MSEIAESVVLDVCRLRTAFVDNSGHVKAISEGAESGYVATTEVPDDLLEKLADKRAAFNSRE